MKSAEDAAKMYDNGVLQNKEPTNETHLSINKHFDTMKWKWVTWERQSSGEKFFLTAIKCSVPKRQSEGQKGYSRAARQKLKSPDR